MDYKKLLIALSILALIVVAGCSAPVEQPQDRQITGTAEDSTTKVAEPPIETVGTDINTADLDDIEQDLDLLLLE